MDSSSTSSGAKASNLSPLPQGEPPQIPKQTPLVMQESEGTARTRNARPPQSSPSEEVKEEIRAVFDDAARPFIQASPGPRRADTATGNENFAEVDATDAPSRQRGDAAASTSSDPFLNLRISFPQAPDGSRLPPLLEVQSDAFQTQTSAASSIGSLNTNYLGPDSSEATTAGGTADAARIPFDIESGDVAEVDKSKLGITDFAAKTTRAALIDSVKTHAIIHPMLALLNTERSTNVQEAMGALVTGLENTLSAARETQDDEGRARFFDVESDLEITHLDEFKIKVQSAFETLSESLEDLQDASENFLSFRARAQAGTSTVTDSIQRNLFGKELHAVLARSVLQSILVMGASAGLQVATVQMLQNYYADNPDKIPEPIKGDARAALGPNASEQDIIKKSIDDFVAPGSTYLDENTSSPAAIYASEAAVGGFRGTIVPMADSINESDARAQKVQSAIDSSNAPKPKLTAGQRARHAIGETWAAQIKANLISGGIAAGVSTAATGATTGSKVMLEIAKTLGFSTISAVNNAAADGFRKAVYTGDNEAWSQTLKAGSRVAGRSVAQAIKTGVSYAQSAGAGELAKRSIDGDWRKAAVQALASGTIKEGLGASVQNLTTLNLPPNEIAVTMAGKAIGSLAEFSRSLNDLTYPSDLPEENREHLEILNRAVENTLAGVLEANSIRFESVDFDAAHRIYALKINEKMNEPAPVR